MNFNRRITNEECNIIHINNKILQTNQIIKDLENTLKKKTNIHKTHKPNKTKGPTSNRNICVFINKLNNLPL